MLDFDKSIVYFGEEITRNWHQNREFSKQILREYHSIQFCSLFELKGLLSFINRVIVYNHG